MSNLTFQLTTLRDFISQEVTRQDTADVDVERFKRELETYLQDLVTALLADLQTICDNCCPGGSP